MSMVCNNINGIKINENVLSLLFVSFPLVTVRLPNFLSESQIYCLRWVIILICCYFVVALFSAPWQNNSTDEEKLPCWVIARNRWLTWRQPCIRNLHSGQIHVKVSHFIFSLTAILNTLTNIPLLILHLLTFMFFELVHTNKISCS